jgi:UDP-N-acetylmuramoyl-tripeptide--D-alanyl-D-alanine ligase
LLKAKVIGVTGSAGKTTTKEFLKAFLACPGTEGNYNNQIGLPITILNCPRDAEFLVLEMGTNHPGEIARLCDIADVDVGVVVSVGSAHLEFFGSVDNIAEEKFTLAGRAKDFSVSFRDLETLEKPPFECPLPGAHNLANMTLAYAVARRLGVSAAQCAERIAAFTLPGSRWRRSEKWGAEFIDDSYNANPDSMIAALDTFAALPCDGRRLVVLGDMLELGEVSESAHYGVGEKAAENGIDAVFTYGERSVQTAKGAADGNVSFVKSFDDKKKLSEELSAYLREDDAVLFKASRGMKLEDVIFAVYEALGE